MPSQLHVVPLLALGALLAACNEAERPLGTRPDRPQFIVSALAGLRGRIAWNTDRDGGPDQDIWIMNADGSRATQLTQNTDIDDGSPTWSPDGKRIAFHSTRDGDYEVFTMNADGSGVTQLTDNASADQVPAWSPDGKQLVFVSDRDGDLEIFLMNADGTGQTQVTHNACTEYNPAWAPGGKQIGFRSDCDGDAEIYVMNVDGTAVTNLTNNTASDDTPAWAPDGKRIAFASDRDGDWEIYVMNADGTGVTQLTNNIGAVDFIPAWSPDGKHLVFTSNRDGDFELFVINADGTGETQLTNDGFADFGLAWTAGTITSPTTQFHFVANGDFGSVSWFEPDPAGGLTFGSLSVSRGGPTNAPQTFLSYFVFQCDFFSCNVIRDGSGLIPNSDLRGGRTALSLNTNTTGNPNFVTFAGPTGVVSMDGRANGLFTQSSSGTNQFSFPGFTQRSQGSSTSASATATGSIVGLPISPNGSTVIGTSHQTTIDIDHMSAASIAAQLMDVGGPGRTQLTSNVTGVSLSTAGMVADRATQFHFVSNGEFASVNWSAFDPAGGGTFGFLSVSRGGPTTNPQTSLSYSVFQCDPFFSCSTVRDGFGLIPNRDLTGSGNSLTLSTNTTGNPNFVTFAGPTGLVSVDWRANGLFTQSSSGTNQFTFPGFTHRFQGSFTSASANATGSIVGLAISPSDSASIGTSHQVNIDISH